MSRNLRSRPSKLASSPLRSPTPRSPSPQSSDSDSYAGVDLITDSDEEEPDVEAAEEQAIMESIENEKDDDDDDAALQPDDDNDKDDESSWGGFDLDDNTALLGDEKFFDEHMARSNAPDLYTEATAWAIEADNDEEDSGEETPTEPRRHVRFNVSSSESGNDDADDNIFPDIFLDQNSLDPAFRRTIENDNNADNDDPPSDSGSYWDFRGDEDEVAENGIENENEEDGSDDDTSSGSSGYETDEGETTEEDLPPAAKFVPARSVLRRQSTESSSSSEEDIAVIRRNPHKNMRSFPRLASWITDATKPYAILDSKAKRLFMFKARLPRRFSFNGTSIRTNPHGLVATPAPQQISLIDSSPMISNSANLMMSAMYTPFDDLLGGQALGPPEAFYPFVSVSANGTIIQEEPSSSYDEDDVDDEDMWNIKDLIDFGDAASDGENGEEEGESSMSQTETDFPSSTPVRPTTATSEDQVHPLLGHFERGVVGAFRRNQTRHQLLSRNVASEDSLAFAGPYRQSPIRGIKGGRLAAANTPITPLRKTRAVKADVLLSPSPALDSAAERKRKFSGEQHVHKRTRSLV